MTSHLLRAAALIGAALLPMAQSPTIQSPMMGPYTGLVTDAAGKPIDGVRVSSGPADDMLTGGGGHYTLTKPQDLVRFSLAGYKPVTKTLNSLTAPVIMQPATERPRALADCSDAIRNDRRQAHMWLRVALPRDAKIKATAEPDYSILALRYHVDWMFHGRGTRWSYGLPELKIWKQLVTVEERDITLENDPKVTIADYSGLLQNGSHYRYIGIAGQSISYGDASVDSANYFDGLLDSLCWSGGAAGSDSANSKTR